VALGDSLEEDVEINLEVEEVENTEEVRLWASGEVLCGE
jgi:hypothetical protein